MELIQELEVWYIIPAIRKELAIEMQKQGLKQVEIAKKLGITKSAINQYLKDKRGNEIQLTERLKQEIKKATTKINTEIDTVKEIQHILDIARQEKIICQIHKILDKKYQGCNVCFENNLVQIK